MKRFVHGLILGFAVGMPMLALFDFFVLHSALVTALSVTSAIFAWLCLLTKTWRAF